MSVAIGAIKEALALDFLTKKGLVLMEKNFRTRFGEIDLIMRDGKYLVFVEVRYRSNPFYGSGLESIQDKKISKIRKTAARYLQKKAWSDKVFCRFDVISASHSGIDWIRDAFL